MDIFDFVPKFFKTTNKVNSKKIKGRVRKPSVTERQLLINEAIELHKKKSKLLDGLSKETRNRLRYVAERDVFKIVGKE